MPHKYGLMDRLYGRRLGSFGTAVVDLPGGLVWKLDLRNPTHRWCVYDSIFDPATARWIRSILRQGGVVIDSGANIGQAIIEFASHRGTRVYAFEPLPECQKWIGECLQLNHGLDVKLVPCGLYSGNCQREIQVAGDAEIHGAHATLRMDWYKTEGYKRIPIDLSALDDFVAAEKIDTIRLWKLDVEGAELEALKGAKSLLHGRRVDALLVETNAHESGVMEYMAELGYLPYLLDQRGNPVRWLAEHQPASDYVFLPTA